MRCQSVLDTIGRTPLIRLNRLIPSGAAEVYVKLEGLNPGGSVKDRPAKRMIEEAERRGLLGPGGTIVESTSGNLGIGLAMAGAVKGYRVVCVVDPRLTTAQARILRALGAEFVMVAEPDENGSYQRARIAKAQELARTMPGAYMPYQYENPFNPQAHYESTAREVIEDLDGPVHAFVAAVSTGGVISGCGRALHERFPGLRVVAVDAAGSTIFGGQRRRRLISGMGGDFAPPTLDPRVIDEVIRVEDIVSVRTARQLARHEGLLVGGSSGAVAYAAREVAIRLGPGRVVVAVLPDTGTRYLDTVFSDEWAVANGLGELVDEPAAKSPPHARAASGL